jgi:tetratricopeptide (TPR) repeat protein
VGNGPGASGTYRIPDEVPSSGSNRDAMVEYRRVAERRMGRRLTLVEADRYWRDLTLRTIARHPVTWLRLLVEKTWLFWNAREIPNTEDYSFVRRLNPVLGLPLIQFSAVAPLALLGTLLWLTRARRGEALVAGINVTFMAALVAFFIVARYRVPALPGLIIAAVGFVRALALAARARSTKALALGAIALVATLPVVFAAKVPKPFDDEWYKLGVAYHRQGRLTEAEHAYQQALRIEPDHLSAHKNRALLREARGDATTARAEWQAVLRIARATSRPQYVAEATEHLRALTPTR